MIRLRNRKQLQLRRLFASFLPLYFIFFIACNNPITEEGIIPKSIKEYHIDCDLNEFQTMFENSPLIGGPRT